MNQETVVNRERDNGGHHGGNRMGAFMLLTGAIFLIGTSGLTIAGRAPGMLVALLPVYWIGVSAYRSYRKEGRLTRGVLSIAVFALLPLAYMAAMTLGYTVSALWPLGIIVLGLSFLLRGGGKES